MFLIDAVSKGQKNIFVEENNYLKTQLKNAIPFMQK